MFSTVRGKKRAIRHAPPCRENKDINPTTIVKIKDIAQLAGVSPGTVDRVLHSRGNVSAASQEAVERVLRTVGYKPNLHLSSIAIKRKYRIAITMPQFVEGEYWWQIQQGMAQVMESYNKIDIEYIYLCYNQFDVYSCHATFEKVIQSKPDAVVIGPTFKDETIWLTGELEKRRIPYLFVDAMVHGTSPIAFFSADQTACGYLLAKLISQISPADSEFAICQAVRQGDESAYNTLLRKTGFMKFFSEKGMTDRVHGLTFSVLHPEHNMNLIGDFFRKNPRVKGAVVLSSRGSVIADYLKAAGLENDVRLACLDLTDSNVRALDEGNIDYVICQRPEQQGFLAVKTILMHQIFGNAPTLENYMPLDIITRENMEYFKGFELLLEF